jgi:arylsulfatase A-like enzyme
MSIRCVSNENLTLALALCFVWSLLGWTQGARANEISKPNIVLINVDDLGWRDLACQGSKYYQTPSIDRLASQGMRFTNAYAAASNCAPSRACMLTGQYGPRHGVYTVLNSNRGKTQHRKLIPTKNTIHIASENLTIADLLRDVGYRTITIGKWHVSKDPIENGFDQNVAGSHIGHPVAKSGGYHSPFNYVNCVSNKKGEYLTDRLTDEAIKFVRESKDEPFFLYLPFYTVHSPLQPKADKKQKWKQVKGQLGQSNASYGAMIESLDENVGRLLKTIDDLDLSDNTIVIFTSDNGGVWSTSHQTPLRSGKGSYFEGGIRVPLIVRWPGRIEPDVTCDEPVINVDFMPTLSEIAGAKLPAGKLIDGVSLVPVLTDSTARLDERALFWHFPIYLQATGRKKEGDFSTHDRWFRTRPGSAIRVGNWKLHEYFEDGRLELYDLATDIGETKNVAATNLEITNKLHGQLKEWRERVNAPIPNALNPKYKSNR